MGPCGSGGCPTLLRQAEIAALGVADEITAELRRLIARLLAKYGLSQRAVNRCRTVEGRGIVIQLVDALVSLITRNPNTKL